jgi:serine protease Do
MKTKLSLPSARAAALLTTALCAGGLHLLNAGEARSAVPPAEKRSLQLNIDRKTINREGADRVSYAPVIKQTAASVVYVYSTKTVKGREIAQFFNDPRLRRFFGIPDGGAKVPDLVQHGLGSGIVITHNGYILTNNHVVEGADDVKVAIGESNKRYDADVIGTDPLADVAVLKIKDGGVADELIPATLGDSDQLQVGDVVLAIGNPFGIGQSVSRGIVSALSRGNLGIEAVEDFIQTDAAINPGNSGGALIDSAGRVVGLNTAILAGANGFSGVGFAIPINLVRRVAEQVVTTGRVDRGFLGAEPQSLTPDLAEQFKTDHGALLAQVMPGGPAAKAGLAAGDVITKVNGTAIRDEGHLLLTISSLAPATPVTIEYVRDGQTRTARALLERRPEEKVAKAERRERDEKLEPTGRDKDKGVLDGVGVADLTPEVRQQLDVPPQVKGAVITEIDPTSASAREGLQAGDVILELNRKPVGNAHDAVDLSKQIKGPKVLARVWREGQTRFIVIKDSTD